MALSERHGAPPLGNSDPRIPHQPGQTFLEMELPLEALPIPVSFLPSVL